MRGARTALVVLASGLAVAYAVAVVAVAWRTADKGFFAFVGRQVVDVTPNGPAERAGLRRGDRIEAVDGQPIASTIDYVVRALGRQPGERLRLGLADRSVELVLEPGRPPWGALAAAVLAAVLAALGLLARFSRPDDWATQRFFHSTLSYAFIYVGALSWNHLLVHPVLAGPFLLALFLAPPLAVDFVLSFPGSPPPGMGRFRLAAWGPTVLLLGGAVVSLSWALADWRAGRPSDAALAWVVRCIAAQLALTVMAVLLGLAVQRRNVRALSGGPRAQVKWLLFGFTLLALPALAAVPFAAHDLQRFLIVGYRPFVVAAAVGWFAAATPAVLRLGLADIDAVIRRSILYAAASAAAAAVYGGVVLAAGLFAGRLAPGQPLPHLIGAAAAAALLLPLRARLARFIDRRFFGERLRAIEALREIGAAVLHLREPDVLANEVVERTAAALQASGAALYLPDTNGLSRRAVRGDGFPERIETGWRGGDDGIDIQVGAGRLVLAARAGGDLYTQEDRALVAALAEPLAVALDNARAYGTIAAMKKQIEQLHDRLEDENRYLKGRLDAARGPLNAILGESKGARELRDTVARVAASSAQVLITGESGTGKGLVARAIHAASDRKDRPFIQVDCGAIAPNLIESELFGHERGAFTGAVRERRGPFELAHGGTLFLDEIGELPLALQPRLLRVLQERSFQRLGGTRTVNVDVRVIAATHRDLTAMAAAGHFREDLLFRLRVVEIAVPPLRARRGDVALLAEALLPPLCTRHRRPLRKLSPDALERLAAYGWPGNVRELQNVLERAVVLSEASEITADDLTLPDVVEPPPELSTQPTTDGDHRDIMEGVEKRRLQAALRAAGGNRSRAARSLGIARTTLINKLRRYNME